MTNQPALLESMEIKGNLAEPASIPETQQATHDGFFCTPRELKLWLPRFHGDQNSADAKFPDDFESYHDHQTQVSGPSDSWPDPFSGMWHDPDEDWKDWDKEGRRDSDSDWETVLMPNGDADKHNGDTDKT